MLLPPSEFPWRDSLSSTYRRYSKPPPPKKNLFPQSQKPETGKVFSGSQHNQQRRHVLTTQFDFSRNTTPTVHYIHIVQEDPPISSYRYMLHTLTATIPPPLIVLVIPIARPPEFFSYRTTKGGGGLQRPPFPLYTKLKPCPIGVSRQRTARATLQSVFHSTIKRRQSARVPGKYCALKS